MQPKQAPPPVIEPPKPKVEEPKYKIFYFIFGILILKRASEKFVLDITLKWKINYDDLEFSDLISTGSAGEVYLGYYFGTPVAIKSNNFFAIFY